MYYQAVTFYENKIIHVHVYYIFVDIIIIYTFNQHSHSQCYGVCYYNNTFNITGFKSDQCHNLNKYYYQITATNKIINKSNILNRSCLWCHIDVVLVGIGCHNEM